MKKITSWNPKNLMGKMNELQKQGKWTKTLGRYENQILRNANDYKILSNKLKSATGENAKLIAQELNMLERASENLFNREIKRYLNNKSLDELTMLYGKLNPFEDLFSLPIRTNQKGEVDWGSIDDKYQAWIEAYIRDNFNGDEKDFMEMYNYSKGIM